MKTERIQHQITHIKSLAKDQKDWTTFCAALDELVRITIEDNTPPPAAPAPAKTKKTK